MNNQSCNGMTTKKFDTEIKTRHLIVFLFIIATIFILISHFTFAVLNDAGLYYTFDINGTINDSTGNDNTAYISGAVFNSSGKINGSYEFGVGKNITLNNTATSSLGFNFTYSFWTNITCSNAGWIISKGRYYSTKGISFGVSANKYFIALTQSSGADAEDNTIACLDGLNFYTLRRVVRGATGYVEVYRNLTLIKNMTGASIQNLYADTPLYIGFNGAGIPEKIGNMDELAFYNYTQTLADQTNAYNNGTGMQPYYVAPSSANITISYQVNNTLTASQINTSIAIYPLNVTTYVYNETNTSFSSDSFTNTPKIYYKINTSLNSGCAIYYGITCVSSSSIYMNKTMTLVDNSFAYKRGFFVSFDDNDVFPAYYPFNYKTMETTTHANFTVYNNNNLKFNVFNFSTQLTYYLNMEFNAINVSTSADLVIYYCNSSYVTGNPASTTNCQAVDTFPATTNYSHQHGSSKHQVIPISITNVTKTQNSTFIFTTTGNIANGWYFEYILNSSYNNKSFVTGNYNTWSYVDLTNNKIFDIHLHPINNSDYFTLYTEYTSTTYNVTNISSSSILFYNVTYQSPNAPVTTSPSCDVNYTLGSTNPIFISWTTSTSPLNYSITYNVSLHNGALSPITSTTNTSYNWTNWSSTITSAGMYHFDVSACDIFSCDTGHSCDFTICANDWQKSVQPCTSDVKAIIYYDANHCSEQLNVPMDNNTYETCTSFIHSNNTGTINTVVSVDDKTYLTVLYLILIIGSFVVATKSAGKWKAMFSLTGIGLILLSMIMFESYRITMSRMTALSYLSIPILMDVIGLGLIVIGILSFMDGD